MILDWVIKSKLLLMKIAGIAAAIVLTFGAGTYVGWTKHELHDAKLPAKIMTINKEVEKKVYVKDLEDVRKLEQDKRQMAIKISELQSQVNENVPQIPTSEFLSVGAVKLLDGATNSFDNSNTAPTSIVSSQDSTTPSTVAWRDFTNFEIGIRGKYNDAAKQCNALIDWVDDNVVNKPGGVKPK